jgi:6-phosphogluconolactonase
VAPRHVRFHPSGKSVYISLEASAHVGAYSYASDGSWTHLNTLSAVPNGVSASAADLRMHPTGKFVYSTNRVSGQTGYVGAFSIADDGSITEIELQESLGEIPRTCAIDPSGAVMLVANQESDTIVSFAINPLTGELDELDEFQTADHPAFIDIFTVSE